MQYCLSNGTINTYKTVKIGDQIWMAENLNHAAEGSVCYDYTATNCDTYGRLYDWATAMAGAASSNAIPSGVQGVCPSGWHIPSNAEWDELFRFADGTNGTSSPYDSETAGRYLKATNGWKDNGNGGEDSYGFAALPGGYGSSGGSSGGSFDYVGYDGYWWSSIEYNSSYAYNRRMFYYLDVAHWDDGDKSNLYSVRCLRD
jgi:uncharacterized protein (TIGR02145 family)